MILTKRISLGSMTPFLNEKSNNLLTFLNVGSIIWSELLFFGCVVISNLYLFQDFVLLNPCFKYSKNLMLSFIDKVTTRVAGWCSSCCCCCCWWCNCWNGSHCSAVVDVSDVMQYYVYVKSSSICQLIKGKSRDLQKLLKYFNETITSLSNVFLSAVVLPIIFALHSKDLLIVVFLLLILKSPVVLFLLTSLFTSSLW